MLPVAVKATGPRLFAVLLLTRMFLALNEAGPYRATGLLAVSAIVREAPAAMLKSPVDRSLIPAPKVMFVAAPVVETVAVFVAPRGSEILARVRDTPAGSVMTTAPDSRAIPLKPTVLNPAVPPTLIVLATASTLTEAVPTGLVPLALRVVLPLLYSVTLLALVTVNVPVDTEGCAAVPMVMGLGEAAVPADRATLPAPTFTTRLPLLVMDPPLVTLRFPPVVVIVPRLVA